MNNNVKFLRAALGQAWGSPDPSTQNGAVIVATNGAIMGVGCNEFPEGVKSTEERLTRPLKYSFVEHAERNAIYDAGMIIDSDVMYALWAACADCARGIIQSGIRTLYTHSFYANGGVDLKDRKNWGESIQVAFEMFEEAGVEVVFIDDQIMLPGESLLYCGESVSF